MLQLQWVAVMGADAVKRVIGTSLGAAALLAAFSVLAQPSQNWVWCENKDNAFAPDVSINGCSALIQSGTESAAEHPHRLQQPWRRLSRQGRSRSRHCRLWRGDQARSRIRSGLPQSRPRLFRQARDRPRHRRLRPGAEDQSALSICLSQSRPRLFRQTRCRSRNCRLWRSHQDRSHFALTPSTFAASPIVPWATTAGRSPTTPRRSGSPPISRLPITTAAWHGATARNWTAPSPTTTRRSGSIPVMRKRW